MSVVPLLKAPHQIERFVESLPGQKVRTYFGDLEFSLYGMAFVVENATVDFRAARLTITPKGHAPWAIVFKDLALLTENRLVATGDHAVLRIELNRGKRVAP